MGDVPKPAPTPDSLPDPASDKLDSTGWKFEKPDVDLNEHIRTGGKDTCYGEVFPSSVVPPLISQTT